MKNTSPSRLLFLAMFLSIVLGMYSCVEKEVHYDVSLKQIDSLLNTDGEVHILLPTGTNIELVESGNKQKGENRTPGSNGNSQAEKDVFSGIKKTMGTQIMSAYATGTFQCPPYCEIVLKKGQ